MKMPILKAFHMLFRVSVKKKGMSTVELGVEVSVQQKTAWLFKRKIQVGMKQDNNNKLQGNVEVDETLLGHHTDRKHGGRSLEERKALMVAVEILPDGKAGNMRMQDIGDFTADTLKFAMKDMVDPNASITTDDYVSYNSLKNQDMNITTKKSEKGKAFPQLHRQIMVFKHWLIGTHHKWSEKHLYAYVDEYIYRFNRRNIRERIFHSVLSKMMNQTPHPYPVIKGLCEYST